MSKVNRIINKAGIVSKSKVEIYNELNTFLQMWELI